MQVNGNIDCDGFYHSATQIIDRLNCGFNFQVIIKRK